MTELTEGLLKLAQHVAKFYVSYTMSHSPYEIQRTAVLAKDEADVKEIFSDCQVLEVSELVTAELTASHKTISLMEG